MRTKKQIIAGGILLTVIAAAYVGWSALRAHRNLVTLDVRNMDVREVVKKLEHQTWEDIYVDKSVGGKVTLRVRGVPLDEVLRMVGDQTQSRNLVLYPLYSGKSSLRNLEKSLRGELDPVSNGWTNLAQAFGGPGGFGGRGAGPMLMTFGAMPDNAGQLVSLNIHNKDLSFAVSAFSRFAQTRVVPEDGAGGTLSLSVNKSTVGKAVAALAAKAKRNWTKVYVLRGFGFGPGRPGGDGVLMVSREPNSGRENRRMSELTDEQREAMRKEREAREQELREALPVEEQQKLEKSQAERQAQMDAMASLSPEQRREQMMQMMGGNRQMDRGNRQRVLNSTPEQRAQMNRREREMRSAGMTPGQRGPGPR